MIERWCLPPEATPAFVSRLEDVLDVYTRPYNPKRPQVGLDETSRHRLADVTPPRSIGPGVPATEDSESERRGVVTLFMVCEPLRGWREGMVSDRRTRIDGAHCIKPLVDVHCPDAEQLVLVQDTLNTHTPAALEEALPPAEAKRLADTLGLHSTPKHGRWLHLAELELGILPGPGLDRRRPDRETLAREGAAWVARRNAAVRTSTWRCTTDDARIKLDHRSPVFHD